MSKEIKTFIISCFVACCWHNMETISVDLTNTKCLCQICHTAWNDNTLIPKGISIVHTRAAASYTPTHGWPKVPKFWTSVSKLTCMSRRASAEGDTESSLTPNTKTSDSWRTNGCHRFRRKASGKGELAHRRVPLGRLLLTSPFVGGTDAAGGEGTARATVGQCTAAKEAYLPAVICAPNTTV